MIPAALRRAAALSLALAIAGCSTSPVETPQAPPRFYQRLDAPGRALDLSTSLGMINLYRANEGQPPLNADPALQRLAEAIANRMASENRVLTEVELALPAAFSANGLKVKSYATNLSAGYRTFAEAFSGWREAKLQNAHMLSPGPRRAGLATAWRPQSKYQVFWVLIVADPG